MCLENRARGTTSCPWISKSLVKNIRITLLLLIELVLWWCKVVANLRLIFYLFLIWIGVMRPQRRRIGDATELYCWVFLSRSNRNVCIIFFSMLHSFWITHWVQSRSNIIRHYFSVFISCWIVLRILLWRLWIVLFYSVIPSSHRWRMGSR